MEDILIKILIIEDNREDLRLIEEMLNEARNPSFELHSSKRLDDGLKYLLRDNFDILLLDLNLPDSTGLDTFSEVYEQAPEIPIVILSGFEDEELALKAVREGAQDYLVKGHVNSLLLSRSISYAIERKLIEDELIRHRYYLNELVEKRTEELEKANEYLQEEVKEKEILIEEIYKRIQFTLQMISGIISINPSMLKKEDLTDLYIKSQTRVNAVMLLNEILEGSEDFAMVDFRKYTKDLADYLFDVYAVDKNLVELNINMDGILLDISTAIPLGLIINELISDKLKRDFLETDGFELDESSAENEYKINLGLKSSNENIILTMNYDNMGGDINELGKLDLAQLQFVRTILDQFNGSIEFIDDKDEINIILKEIKI